MKNAKWVTSALMVLLFAVALALFSTTSYAGTHTRGGLTCYNCHTMHYSEEGGVPARATAGGPFKSLLIDQKDNGAAINTICLKCHDDRAADASGAPTVFTPNDLQVDPYLAGGDFDTVSAGGENGHFKLNGNDLNVDDSPDPAPGGCAGANCPDSSELRCWSCHDPHNSPTGSNDFRLLRKRPKDGTGADTYTGSDLTVEASGGSMAANESGTNHSVFVSGISSWCGACHSSAAAGSGFHGSAKADADVGDGADWIRHPTDNTVTATVATEYNNEDVNEPDWHIPLQDDDQDWATDTATHATAAGTDSVMCLSCHRAHTGRAPGADASYYENALRFDPQVGINSDVACNKCHDK